MTQIIFRVHEQPRAENYLEVQREFETVGMDSCGAELFFGSHVKCSKEGDLQRIKDFCQQSSFPFSREMRHSLKCLSVVETVPESLCSDVLRHIIETPIQCIALFLNEQIDGDSAGSLDVRGRANIFRLNQDTFLTLYFEAQKWRGRCETPEKVWFIAGSRIFSGVVR
jgi:hypothetical protein